MELRWKISDSASCFHAAAAMAGGRKILDAELAAALEPSLAGFMLECSNLGCDGSQLLDRLSMLGTDFDNNQQLASVALMKLTGCRPAESSVAGLTRSITALENAYLRIRPQIAEELALRSEPLRGQWEARGPGLLRQLAQLTEPLVVAEAATVAIVQPVLGGFGAALIPSNLVRIEGLIADPLPTLPEVVRLAWLLSQLNLDLPMFQDGLSRDRLFEVGALALLPAVLMAAEKVELVGDVEQVLPVALGAWEREEELAPTLLAWWDTYHATKPAWVTALAALDTMLSPGAGQVPDAPAD
jgi:hypothetical protein